MAGSYRNKNSTFNTPHPKNIKTGPDNRFNRLLYHKYFWVCQSNLRTRTSLVASTINAQNINAINLNHP